MATLFPNTGMREYPPVRANEMFTGTSPVFLVKGDSVFGPLKGKIQMGKCNGVVEGSVAISVYNQGGFLVGGMTDTTPGVLATGTDVYGTIESYGPNFIFSVTTWLSLPLSGGGWVVLQYSDQCGVTHTIRIAELFDGMQDSLDVTYPSGVSGYHGVMCPINLCGDCEAEVWVTHPSDAGLMVKLGYFEKPTGVFVLEATELYPGLSFHVDYAPNGNAYDGFQFAQVGLTVQGVNDGNHGLPIGTRVEVRVCGDVYPLNDCNKCCTYTTELNSDSLDVNAWLGGATSPFVVTSLVINGNNILTTPYAGIDPITDLASLVNALTQLGYGEWVTDGDNLISPKFTTLVFESITLSDTDTPAVTSEFAFGADCTV